MTQAERRHDRLAVRLSLIISRLVAGETLSVRKLAAEFGVSVRTLRRDFRERLMYLDLSISPDIAIIAIVVIVIILNKTGVSDSLAALTLATVAALLTGGGAAGAASVALTPFVGVPVGIFVGIYVFAKVVRLISGKK